MTVVYREVPKQEFYSVVGPQDVHPTIEGRYPYTSIFKTKSRQEIGRIDTEGRCFLVVDSRKEGSHGSTD